jgi:hypothetical protein
MDWKGIGRQERHAKEEGYRFIRQLVPGCAVFVGPEGKEEIWQANLGHANYGFRFRGTDWEFVRSV